MTSLRDIAAHEREHDRHLFLHKRGVRFAPLEFVGQVAVERDQAWLIRKYRPGISTVLTA